MHLLLRRIYNKSVFFSIVNELLRHGNLSSACFIEVEDDTFNTPLLLACESGHYSVARVLLEAKADPNVRLAYFKDTS